jgi:hypothetical protein
MGKFRILILLLFISCAPKNPMPFNETHEDMWPYINYFEELTKQYVFIPVNYGDTGNYLGVCRVKGLYRWVIINKFFFDTMSEESRLVLILHELGHCVLNKKHDDRLLSDGCAYSIMNTYHIGSYCYNLHTDHYLKEFTNGL